MKSYHSGVCFLLPLLMLVSACGTTGDNSPGGSEKDLSETPQDLQYTGEGEAFDSREEEGDLPDLFNDTGPPIPTDCDVDAECDDSNICTDGACIQGECVYSPVNGGECDDGKACTVDDLCDDGICQGVPLDCEDGLPCTLDSCLEGACVTEVDEAKECRLHIEVTAPGRAETFHATGAIDVSGTVVSPAGPVQTLNLNGTNIPVKDDGSFNSAMFAQTGINILSFEAKDVFDRQDTAARAFLYAEELYQVGSDKALVYMPGASHAFLKADVWDDNSTGDLDDIATAVFLLVNNLDVNQFIPDDMVYASATCTWTINVSQVSYKLQSIDIIPQNGSLKLKGNFINFKAWLDAVASWCPDGHGWVTADNIAFEATFDVYAATEKLQIDLTYMDVEISGVKVDLQEGLASLFDWLLNWFDGTFANLVEGQLESLLPEEVIPLLVSLLNGFLEQEQEINIPPIPGTASQLPLVLRTRPEEATFTAAGSAFKMSVGVGSKKLIQHSAPGTLKRGDCKGTESGSFNLPKSGKLEAAISEDLVNQLLFALWWGGHLTVSLSSDVLDPLLEGLGVTGLEITLDPYLPPVYSSCNPESQPQLQFGDMNIWASFSMGSNSGEIEIFTSAKVSAEVVISEQPDGNLLGLKVGDLTTLAMDVVSSEGMFDGNDELMTSILTELIVDMLLKQYLASVLAAYPIPEINLSALGDFFPPGSQVTFEPTKAIHDLGFILLSGQPL
jgi:hypothetical protein